MIIKDNQKIYIRDEYFDPTAVCTCGQVFRYKKVDNNWIVCSLDKKATIKELDGQFVIEGDSDYFYDYFDLGNDYEKIVEEVSDKPLIGDALKLGKGIRILKQDPFETVIEFIISANNLIPRIKGIIERICINLGENKGDYYSFPTIEKMASVAKDFYTKLGCGYRDEYLSKTARAICDGKFDLGLPFKQDTETAKKYLMTLTGVGPKVADCILLFAYQKYDVFPVDTWIKKLYFRLFPSANPKTQPKTMRSDLVSLYGKYAGIAQQYLFYSIRENK